MARENENISALNVNRIVTGTEIVGNIKSTADIRIDGHLKGNLKTKGKIVIGETGSISGEVVCKNSEIEGIVDGKIVVAELLSLKATSKINGDIDARKLAIEPGAKFTGNCKMNPDQQGNNSNVVQEAPEKTVSTPEKPK